MKGIVKWFNYKKGYGFILGEDKKEYFVHYTNIITNEEFKSLKKGQKVIFELGDNDKGKVAIKVTVVNIKKRYNNKQQQA